MLVLLSAAAVMQIGDAVQVMDTVVSKSTANSLSIEWKRIALWLLALGT